MGRNGDDFPGMAPNCLRMSVVRARALPAMDFGWTSDPYVRISLVSTESYENEDSDPLNQLLFGDGRPSPSVLRRPGCRRGHRSAEGAQHGREGMDTHVISQAETEVRRQTLNPRWYQSFKLQCEAPEDNERDVSGLCPKLLLEVFDHDDAGPPDFMGRAVVRLENHLDRSRRRFWTSLESSSTVATGLRGELEVVVQYHQVSFECLSLKLLENAP